MTKPSKRVKQLYEQYKRRNPFQSLSLKDFARSESPVEGGKEKATVFDAWLANKMIPPNAAKTRSQPFRRHRKRKKYTTGDGYLTGTGKASDNTEHIRESV